MTLFTVSACLAASSSTASTEGLEKLALKFLYRCTMYMGRWCPVDERSSTEIRCRGHAWSPSWALWKPWASSTSSDACSSACLGHEAN